MPDSKLARRLQKRGKWPNYTTCLTVVQKWMTEHDMTMRQIKDAVDRGELDPK